MRYEPTTSCLLCTGSNPWAIVVLNHLQDQATTKLKSSLDDGSGRVGIWLAANILYFLYFHPRSELISGYARPSSVATLMFRIYFLSLSLCLAEFADIYGTHLELRFFNLAQVGFEPTISCLPCTGSKHWAIFPKHETWLMGYRIKRPWSLSHR